MRQAAQRYDETGGNDLKKEQDEKPWILTLVNTLQVLVLGVLVTATVVSAGSLRGTAAVSASAPAEACGLFSDGQKTLVPLGQTAGMKLFSQGVMVIGLSDIATAQGDCSPARDCGLKEGDIITHINSEQVDTIEEVQQLLQTLEGETMSIRALRSGKQVQLTGEAVQCSADGSYKLGAWIRDSMAGIGTLTWYDPETGVFAALGHGINDVDTGSLMPLQTGAIMDSSVTDVKKGVQGQPGELHGSFDLTHDTGTLYANTDGGVFGVLEDPDSLSGQALPVASHSQVQTGKATILSNISGDTVEEYEVEILRVYPASASDTRNLMLKVTDPRLLEATGGIVQGMSGSPILQNGRLVGAVTHVLINDPTCGYGILAENMLTYSQSFAPSV